MVLRYLQSARILYQLIFVRFSIMERPNSVNCMLARDLKIET